MKSIIQFLSENIKLNSTRVIIFGFMWAIIIGALLLMLPCSTAAGCETSFLTALFTSATSICVTGLVVVDTCSHWTLFGQFIILLLIQIGGLGVITLYSLGIMIIHRRFSLKMNILLQDYYNLTSLNGVVNFMKKVVAGTLIVECLGAILYSLVFVPEFGLHKGIWVSVFTSVSAFCNAGIDIIAPDSLCRYSGSIIVNMTTVLLVVMGGLGYVVWFDVHNSIKKCRSNHDSLSTVWRKLNEHSKLIITLTVFLLLSGTFIVLVIEGDNPGTLGPFSPGKKAMAALFQSMTFRTAGFSTVPQQNLEPLTCLYGILFMFIGGSPIGTAGGVKTVTLFILILNVRAFICGRDETLLYGHSISQKMINKATAIIMVSLSTTMVCLILLVSTNNISIMDAAYEIFSATGTVGLSRGVTANLNQAGRIIDILAMYLGRIGPISMALFFSINRSQGTIVKHAEGRFYVG